MASIDYPFPNPENNAEREANREASDEYQRQEEEASDFLDWEEELKQ
ncbi:hypothetical protein [Streptomyces stelliscabiei]|nr:hypothetical protein [Streptomyces stelliscabiei]MDX2557643.1 hypothetical protein [Streptomyces stelliscabiei]MDX2617104.1 hypothetical protein [Streptomyces stelliscabiei]MDX2641478.1 hypothetical protein [Streptomyces stelliscabiei]MDX2666472.1 hypothetical protein [Streptomyces stelliscabiei]MDX2717331.1 hypothetical protein [Streptomyces stelliscabiei]